MREKKCSLRVMLIAIRQQKYKFFVNPPIIFFLPAPEGEIESLKMTMPPPHTYNKRASISVWFVNPTCQNNDFWSKNWRQKHKIFSIILLKSRQFVNLWRRKSTATTQVVKAANQPIQPNQPTNLFFLPGRDAQPTQPIQPTFRPRRGLKPSLQPLSGGITLSLCHLSVTYSPQSVLSSVFVVLLRRNQFIFLLSTN